MPDPAPATLASLCERAIARDLDRQALDAAWPEPVTDPALIPLRDALADGIEHTPIDGEAWRHMPDYADIQFYLAQLRQR